MTGLPSISTIPRVVSFPFTKFFNHAEPLASELDLDSTVVEAKKDGSLLTMYHYAGLWHVSTTGTPDASGICNGYDFTFKDLFWNVWYEHTEYSTNDLDPNYSYMFELETKYNPQIVIQRKSRLTLLAIRNLTTLKEVDIDNVSNAGNFDRCTDKTLIKQKYLLNGSRFLG